MQRWVRSSCRLLLPLAAAFIAAAPARAQERPWTVILEGGVSDMHGETAADGGAGALRLARRIAGYDWMRAEVAFTGGAADEDFGTAELGIELRLCPTCRIVAFVGGGGGFLYEPEWNGGMLRANAGLEGRISSRLSVRAMAQAGTHDGVRGPHLAMIGLAWRFGSP